MTFALCLRTFAIGTQGAQEKLRIWTEIYGYVYGVTIVFIHGNHVWKIFAYIFSFPFLHYYQSYRHCNLSISLHWDCLWQCRPSNSFEWVLLMESSVNEWCFISCWPIAYNSLVCTVAHVISTSLQHPTWVGDCTYRSCLCSDWAPVQVHWSAGC